MNTLISIICLVSFYNGWVLYYSSSSKFHVSFGEPQSTYNETVATSGAQLVCLCSKLCLLLFLDYCLFYVVRIVRSPISHLLSQKESPEQIQQPDDVCNMESQSNVSSLSGSLDHFHLIVTSF